MQTGGEHVGACLQRHLEAGERCAGAGLAAAQVLAAKERGVEMRTSTEVIELVIEDGQVLGVVARDGAGTKRIRARLGVVLATGRSEEHTSELQSLMRISYAVFCLKKNKKA